MNSTDNAYLTLIKDVTLSKKKNLQQQIYKFLLDLIIKGLIPENTFLSENIISIAFKVSKTPVREALKKLELDGLIKIMPHGKTHVLPINAENVNSSHKIRKALELLIVTEAINNIEEEDYEILDNFIIKQQEALGKKDFELFFEYDVAFHFQIAKIAKLLSAWTILKRNNLHIDRVRFLTKNDYPLNNKVIKEHIYIAEAIKDRDVVLATKYMDSHLEGASSFLEGHFKTIKNIHNLS